MNFREVCYAINVVFCTMYMYFILILVHLQLIIKSMNFVLFKSPCCKSKDEEDKCRKKIRYVKMLSIFYMI